MLLLLIIPLLISGFYTCHIHPYYFYKLHRHEGQYLYIHTAYLGLRCFILSILLNIIAHNSLIALETGSHINWLENIIKSSLFTDDEESIKASWYISVSICSVFIIPSLMTLLYRAYLYLYLKIKSLRIQDVYIIEQILKDSPLDKFLLDACLSGKAIMLSMKDRKVYVGIVLTTGEPNEAQAADQEISIRPILSGVRCKDTLTVTFNTPYKEIKQDQELIIILRQDDIVSATYFDEDVFNQFQSIDKTPSPKTNLCY